MTAFKRFTRSTNSLFLLAIILMAFSLFGHVVPSILNFEIKTSETAEISQRGPHPLIGSSDNVVQCTANGIDLHEIYLCGANDDRLLVTNISNATQITWSQLDASSCAAADLSCPNTAPSCTWNQLSTDTQYNVTDAGEYKIFVQYADGTSEQFYFNVYANGLNPNALVQNIDCGSPGSIIISNVPSGYEYSITSGASWQDSNVFPINSVSTYDIQIRKKNDAGGCVLTMNDISVENNSIDATATVNQITCNSATGSITIDIANASTSYIYKLTQGGNLLNSSGPITNDTYTFSNLDVGNYDVEVTLASVSNCAWNGNFTIDPFTVVAPDAVVTKNIDCTDGVITLTKTGGNSPFEYSLDNGISYVAFTAGNQTTIPIATTGSYAIKVRDASNCVSDANTVNVITESEIAYTVTPNDVSCSGVDDGSIAVEVTNTQGYSVTYSIDGANFQTSKVFSNLAAGSYDVIIRKQKAGGTCDLPAVNTTVGNSPAFVVTAAITQQINCTTGSATIETTVGAGATAPLEYSLDGLSFQTSNIFTGLGAGDYTITVRDANQCTATVDQTVTSSSELNDLTFLTSNIDCSTGATDVQITVQGGQSPFSYRITAPTVISNGPSDSFTALTPNTYTFEVTADNGCIIIRNFTVPQPIGFNANASVKTNVSCAGTSALDGSIDITIENFDTSFNVIVEDGTGTDTGLGVTNATASPITITGLAADTYTIRIGDASGPCQQVETLTIAEPAMALSLDSFAVSPMNCGSPGSVTIEASGGWGNYSYQVIRPDATTTPVQSNKNITGLTQAGTHTIILTDINGCVINNVSFDLLDQGGPTATVDKDYAGGSPTNYCYSTATPGILKIDVSGGEAPYFYTVNNGTPVPVPTGDSFVLNNLTPFNYVIKLIGNNGCETIVADTKIAGQLFALAEITKPLGCGTPTDATIEVVPQEGYPPFTYALVGDPSATPVAMPYSASTAGTYSFIVTDSEGCTTTTNSVEVTDSPPITPAPNITDTACGKPGTGSVELAATGGTPPFTYSFNGSPFTTQSLYTGLDAISYDYIIRDDLGCETAVQQVTIGAEAAITADVSDTDISCNPVIPPGGNIWGNTRVTNVQNATGLVVMRLIRVSSPAAHAAGTARYWQYRESVPTDMSDPASFYDFRMYWPHWFYVEIEDEKGCIFESPLFEITQPPLPWIQKPEVDLDQSCANGASFQVEVGDPAGLVGPFSYRIWPYDENNAPAWRSFEVPNYNGIPGENQAFGEDVDAGTMVDLGGGVMGIPERDFRVSGLLFGVNYAIVIRDEATGCQRWRSMGVVHAPEAPDNNIDVVSTPQSLSCFTGNDGRVRFSIAGAGDQDNDGDQTVDWKIRHASDLGVGNNSPAREANFATFRKNGTYVGPATGDFEFEVPDLKLAWYVAEVTTESGCKSGNRFLIYRPKSRLRLDIDQVVAATCNVGAQISVVAKGGWDDQRYFNIRNKLDQASWHEYEYAFVPSGTTPVAADWGSSPFKEVPYDGANPNYDIYVRDGGGCEVMVSTPVTIDPQPSITKVDVLDRCFDTDGNEIYEVNATVTLGEGTNVYIWDGTVTNSNVAQLGPGQHTLIVRDENGCETPVENIHIYPQLVPQIEISKTLNCDSGNPENGEITASAYGGSGTYEFTIEPIPGSYAPGEETNATGVFDRLTSGVNYRVLVTDFDPQVPIAERCAPEYTEYLQLEAPAIPDFTAEVLQHISCRSSATSTSNDGVIRVVQTPAVDNLDVIYEFSIDGGAYQTSNLFENLAPGTHTINVRSAKHCIQPLGPLTINAPTQLVLSANETSTFSCTASNDIGMATIDATVDVAGSPTGTAPYQYSFDGGSFGSTTTYELPYSDNAQTVTINVIDANGCTDQAIVNIAAVTKLTATHTVTSPMDCATDGEYEIVIPASITSYSIVELPSASSVVTIAGTTINIQRGNPGNYSFLITDTISGCTDNVVIEIPAFDTLDMLADHVNDVTCYNGSDGALEFSVSGYSGPFEYTVFDSNDVAVPGMSNLLENTSTGTISVTGLRAGTYYIDLRSTSAPGCKEISNFVTIQSPTLALGFQASITNELTCNPGSDAQITVTPEGGWGTYSLDLVLDSSGASMPANATNYNIFDNLDAGAYTLTVTDGQGCPHSEPIIVPLIDLIQLDPAGPAVVQPSCTGFNDASITVSASRVNGPAAYEYILNNLTTGVSALPQASNSFNGLPEGDYSVSVIDGYGCDVTTAPIYIRDPAGITIDAAITQEPTCPPNDVGEITVTGAGGSGSYNFRIIAPASQATAWTATASVTHVFSSLPSGTYEMEARDATFLCPSPITAIRTINVVEPLEVTVDTTNTTINCNGENDAILVALAEKGLGGYEYQLEDDAGAVIRTRQTTGIFDMLGAGNYRIRAFSGLDCEALSELIVIDQPALLDPVLGPRQDVQCFGDNDGSFEITFNSGEAPFKFILSTEPSKAVDNALFEGLAPGTYSVTVQDVNGCEAIVSGITIGGPLAALEATVNNSQDEVCAADDDGSFDVEVTGGTAPYSYSLGDPNGTYTTIAGTVQNFTNLDAGFYEVYVRDDNGCEAPPILHEIKAGSDLRAEVEIADECMDGNPFYSATITLVNDQQDTTQLMYSLDGNPSQLEPTFSGISAGSHTILIEDSATGCNEPVTFEVIAQEPLTLVQQQGEINQILVQAGGGDGNHTYYFEGVPQATGGYYITRDGTYTVRVVDGKGCETAIQIPMAFIDIEIPNFFSPDGDGINDVWRIKNNEAFPNMFVHIYDRYGRTIKEFIGNGDWDGTYNNQILPAGDYWYVIKLNGVKDEREFVGHFSIYR